MSSIYNQYKKPKPKRVRDPNLPPAPTLLGQVKELKGVRLSIDELQSIVNQQQKLIARQQHTLERFGAKLRQAETAIEHLTNTLKRK